RAGAECQLELRDLLTAFVAVCNTLPYAHAQGGIHRDLKSANVVLGSFGEGVVLDWGLARVLRDNADEKAATPVLLDDDPESRPDVKGTLAYMAPEQAQGKMDRVDRRSDVFGLGAILYDILAGRPPYEGNTLELYRQAKEGRVASVRACAPWAPRALS